MKPARRMDLVVRVALATLAFTGCEATLGGIAGFDDVGDGEEALVEGELRVVAVDQPYEEGETPTGRIEYSVVTEFGRLIRLGDAAGRIGALRPGMWIRAQGVRDGDNVLEIAATGTIAATAAPDGALTGDGLASASLTSTGVRRVGVVLFKFRNDAREPITLATAKARVFTNADSVRAYMREASYGQLDVQGVLDATGGDAFGWYTIDFDNGTCIDGDCCPVDRWSAAAREQAAAAGVSLAAYDHVVFGFNGAPGCEWAGLAPVPGHELWVHVPPDQPQWFGPPVIAHELGHNFGLFHAGSARCTNASGATVSVSDTCTYAAYGDPYDRMGSGSLWHFGAVQKAKLAWIPQSAIQVVTSSGDYTIAPLEQAAPGAIQSLLVPVTTVDTRHVFYAVELRQPFGLDAFSSTSPAVTGVVVRRMASYCWQAPETDLDTVMLDMTPSTPGNFGDGTLALGRTFTDDAHGVSISVVSLPPGGPATVRVTVPGSGAEINALQGEYFDNRDFTSPKATRADPIVSFDWCDPIAPPGGTALRDFSVRWTGRVRPRHSETYTFYTHSDDGVRLFVDGRPLVDNWTFHSPMEDSGAIPLTGGQLYDVRMETFNGAGASVARLLWSSASEPKAVVPASQLFPPGYTDGMEPPPPPFGSGTGLRGEYFDNADLSAPKVTRVDSIVSFDWGSGSPATTIAADSFSVRWTGEVEARYSETYTFYVTNDDGVRLWIDGRLLIDAWTAHPPSERSATVAFTAGTRHAIKVEYFESTGGAVARLSWSSPSEPKAIIARTQLYPAPQVNGLRADYFDNRDLTAPRVTRIDGTVNFAWGTAAPVTGVAADTFSVRWTGTVRPAFSQTYTFYTLSDDGVRLWVNGRLLVDNWTTHSPTENRGTISLTAGRSYAIRMELFDNTGSATAKLSWSSASQTKQVVPRARLFAY